MSTQHNSQIASSNVMARMVLVGAFLVLATVGMMAQGVWDQLQIPAERKFSIGIESGLNFSRFVEDSSADEETTSGRGAYMNVTGSCAFSDIVGLQFSCGYEEIRRKTEEKWEAPETRIGDQVILLPDSMVTKKKHTVSVSTPHVSLTAGVRFDITPWLAVVTSGTAQIRTGEAVERHDWLATDTLTQRMRFHQSTTLRGDSGLPAWRLGADVQIMVTPLRTSRFDLTIYAGYRHFIEQEEMERRATSDAETSAPIRNPLEQTAASASLTDMTRMGIGFSYRF